MRALTLVFLLFVSCCMAQHPVAFARRSDLETVRANLSKYPLLQQSFNDIKKSVDPWLGKDIDVPVPKDPAGGYTHERHHDNYMLVFNAGLLYNLTGNAQYATLARNILVKYAALNPTLGLHPQATSSSPGHIFWQALNDANWLVYCGLGYDLIYNAVTPADRKLIENGAFKPEVDFITKGLESWFNLIHNHGVWACAGVGIVGIASNNEEYIHKALYGTKGDGKSGFLAQMDQLFSPDGYYTEGPYYVRYATLPFYMFANALNNAKPELKIFERRNQILRKALLGGLQQTNTDGMFFPWNDAIKDKDYTSNEVVTAAGIAWQVYGPDPGLLTVAAHQGRVLLNRGGASLAAAVASSKKIDPYYPYRSISFTDGARGDEGGVSYLRLGKGAGLTTLGFKYAAHGLSHGHYDALNFFLYDKGTAIFQDYGSARFVNVEQKYGGRYLPENSAYAAQTIAHNTLVVDEASQFNANEDKAQQFHSVQQFAYLNEQAAVQAVSAAETHAYKNVDLSRSFYLLQMPDGKRIVVDLFRAQSPDKHEYDLPFQYNGQVIGTNFKYKAAGATQQAMGKKNGYQYLWKEAEAQLADTLAQFTFLNGGTYYSISSLVQDSAQIFFTRLGANDPNFNLRREPSFIIRKKGGSQLFASVLEIHGKFDPVAESSTGSYPSVSAIHVLQNSEELTAVHVIINKKDIIIAQCNKDFGAASAHKMDTLGRTWSWTGPFAVWYDGKEMEL